MKNSEAKQLRIKRINHVGVPVSERRRALPFFRDILGLDIIPSMVDANNIVWMQTEEGTMVHLIEPSSGRGITSGWHLALEVEDFDEALSVLKEKGIKFADGPGERHDGQKYVFLTDPDGNRVEITSPSNLRPSRRVVDVLGRTTEPRNKRG